MTPAPRSITRTELGPCRPGGAPSAAEPTSSPATRGERARTPTTRWCSPRISDCPPNAGATWPWPTRRWVTRRGPGSPTCSPSATARRARRPSSAPRHAGWLPGASPSGRSPHRAGVGGAVGERRPQARAHLGQDLVAASVDVLALVGEQRQDGLAGGVVPDPLVPVALTDLADHAERRIAGAGPWGRIQRRELAGQQPPRDERDQRRHGRRRNERCRHPAGTRATDPTAARRASEGGGARLPSGRAIATDTYRRPAAATGRRAPLAAAESSPSPQPPPRVATIAARSSRYDRIPGAVRTTAPTRSAFRQGAQRRTSQERRPGGAWFLRHETCPVVPSPRAVGTGPMPDSLEAERGCPLLAVAEAVADRGLPLLVTLPVRGRFGREALAGCPHGLAAGRCVPRLPAGRAAVRRPRATELPGDGAGRRADPRRRLGGLRPGARSGGRRERRRGSGQGRRGTLGRGLGPLAGELHQPTRGPRPGAEPASPDRRCVRTVTAWSAHQSPLLRCRSLRELANGAFGFAGRVCGKESRSPWPAGSGAGVCLACRSRETSPAGAPTVAASGPLPERTRRQEEDPGRRWATCRRARERNRHPGDAARRHRSRGGRARPLRDAAAPRATRLTAGEATPSPALVPFGGRRCPSGIAALSRCRRAGSPPPDRDRSPPRRRPEAPRRARCPRCRGSAAWPLPG